MMMERLIKLLHDGNYSCVIENSQGIYRFTRKGVADLYDLYLNESEMLADAGIADKVVGKAAASLMILGKVKSVYADVISSPALALLDGAGIEVTYATEVHHIENREKSGWCPLEAACNSCKTAADAYPLIKDFITRMRKHSTITK